MNKQKIIGRLLLLMQIDMDEAIILAEDSASTLEANTLIQKYRSLVDEMSREEKAMDEQYEKNVLEMQSEIDALKATNAELSAEVMDLKVELIEERTKKMITDLPVFPQPQYPGPIQPIQPWQPIGPTYPYNEPFWYGQSSPNIANPDFTIKCESTKPVINPHTGELNTRSYSYEVSNICGTTNASSKL